MANILRHSAFSVVLFTLVLSGCSNGQSIDPVSSTIDLPSPLELVRTASDTGYTMLNASEYKDNWPHEKITPNAPTALLEPQSGELITDVAYAIYQFDLTGIDPQSKLIISWDSPPSASDVWAAFSDWDNNRWVWYGTNNASAVSVPNMGEYTAEDGTLLVTLGLTGSSSATLNSLSVLELSIAAPGNWWCFGHDRQHTRTSPFIGPQTENVDWFFPFEWSDTESSAAIGADSTIYVGSPDSNLFAINPDGALRWSYKTAGRLTSSPALGTDGTIYIGGTSEHVSSGYIYAINPDGTHQWSISTDGFVYSSPAIGVDGTIYVGCLDSNLYAVNRDGTLKWKYATDDRIHSSPAIGSDGTIYVGSDDNNLYAVNPDGTMKWKYTTRDRIRSSPAISTNGTIYIGSNDNNLYAINPNGTIKWTYTSDDDITSSPAISSNQIIYFGSHDHKLYAINPDSTLKWSYETDDSISSSPSIGVDGTIYVGSWDGQLYSINSNGTLNWACLSGTGILSSPAIAADGTLYICSGASLVAVRDE